MISVTAWQQALRASDLPLATKGVLYILSTYADWTTGEHARPGELIQTECGIPRKTAYNHIKAAIDAGWLVQTCHGSTAPKRNWSNEYRLAIPDHGSSVADGLEGTTDHGSSVTDDRPTMGHSGTDHGSPVTPHLDIAPHHESYLVSSGEVDLDRPDEVATWDGDTSRLILPARVLGGSRPYYVSADGRVRQIRGLPRAGEVRVDLDLLDIQIAQRDLVPA